MVRVIGHRGAAGYAPENTLSSFQKAIDLGCDRAELDVRLSADGVPMVFHDEDLNRLMGRDVLVKNMSFADLRNIRGPQGHRIHSLQEVIDYCEGKISLQIELKEPGTPEKVLKILENRDPLSWVVITSFSLDLLGEVKRSYPSIRIGYLFNDYTEDLWRYVNEIPLDFIGPRGEIVTRGLVDRAHSLGKGVYAFHVNDRSLGQRLKTMGVDEMGTDYPKLFLDNKEK